MNKQILTAPCGLDCFNCPMLEDNITDDEKRHGSILAYITGRSRL